MQLKTLLFITYGFCLSSLTAQNVGIGTGTPQEKLDVQGGVKLGMNTGTQEGTMRYNPVTTDFEGRVGDQWLSFTGGQSKWGNTEQFAWESGGIYGFGSDTLFGETISISGQRLIVGAPKTKNGIYPNSGKVQVLNVLTTGQTGHHNTIYSPYIASNNYFGRSVSLFNSELVIGEPNALVSGNTQQGRAYVYKLNTNNQPTLSLELIQTDSEGSPFDKFGYTVAIWGDYIAVSAPEKTVGGNVKQGKVYMYRRLYIFGAPTDAFLPETTLTAPDGIANMQFGKALSLSPNCLVVGAPHTVVNGNQNAGKVYIYRRVTNNWQFEASVTALNPLSQNYYGHAVSTNVIGDTVVVGAPRSIDGFVSVLRKSGSNWSHAGYIYGPNNSELNSFGCAVDFKGGRILVGAEDARVGISYQQGKAYLFAKSGTSWAREASFTPQSGAQYLKFGRAVQLAADRVVISAPGYATQYHTADVGRVYWFFRN